MSYPTGYYKKETGLRIRPVPEWQSCVVFTPHNPELYTLNVNAWLILELCDNASPAALEAAYLDTVSPLLERGEAQRQLQAGLTDLQNKGIVKLVGPSQAS